jgi:hypothetical protein
MVRFHFDTHVTQNKILRQFFATNPFLTGYFRTTIAQKRSVVMGTFPLLAFCCAWLTL